MTMRERFTDEEWALIRHVPFDAFVFATLADKDVSEAEIAAFTEMIEKAATLSDPLHREIAVDWAAAGATAIGEEFKFELTESGSAMAERLERTKPALKDKLTTGEYQSFVRSVTVSCMAIAAASTKKKRMFHKQEKPLSPEEIEAIAAFAVAFDVDLAALQTLLQ